MPLIRWTSRSPATPVPYSFQQRQRAKVNGSKGFFGTVPCQVSQSRVCGDRSGGGGYSQAPVGSLRPSVASIRLRSPIAPLAIEFLGLGTKDGAGALRADLHDAIGLLCGGHHGQAVCRVVRHGLLAIDILAGSECVHDDLLMPVIGNRDDDGVDIFGVEQFLIAPRGANRFAYDLAGEQMATIVEVRGGNALHAAQLDGSREKPLPSMPTPTMPKRTRSLAAAGSDAANAASESRNIDAGTRDAPAAPAVVCRKVRRESGGIAMKGLPFPETCAVPIVLSSN